MLLKSLEIYGFKSFADRTKIQFDKGITGIVGPNGSGKSNILDAIRWVLGEQSAKSLRGAKMEDIIFSGTQHRNSLGFAEVSLTLDNSNASLPIEFTEVTVTRRLYRSGESEYYINRNQCRLKDILELFMDTGIGKEGYSIIGQGRIDQILSTNADDRRGVLEEAAGIVKYKTRREEAQKKLERTRDNLIRVEDILYEISNQIEPLKLESDKAKDFLRIKEELKFYELNRFVIEYNRLADKMQKSREHIEQLSDEIDIQKKSLIENEEKREELRATISDKNKQIEKWNIKIHDLEYSIKTMEGNIDINTEKISQAQKNNRDLDIDIQTEDGERRSKLEKIEHLESELVDKDNDRSILSSQRDECAKELETIESRLACYREEVSRYKYDFDTIREKISKGREAIAHMEAELLAYDDRFNQLNENLQCKKGRLEELKADRLNYNDNIDKLKQELATLVNERQGIEQDLRKLKEKSGQLGREMTDTYKSLENKKARFTLLNEMDKNYEGYYRSVKAILTAVDKGIFKDINICGVVAELIEVPKGLEKAIETALGNSVQFIITGTEEDAKVVIEYLKKYNHGRATFLPLTSVKGRELNKKEQQVLNMDGCIGIASHLIDYDERYAEIFKYLLGRIIIVKTMDEAVEIARNFSYSFKIVTMDGDVVNAGGSITGGSTSSKGSNLISRRREVEELKDELRAIHTKMERLYEEDKYVQTKLDEASARLKQLGDRIGKKNMDIAVSMEKAQGLEKNIRALEIEIEEDKNEKEIIRQRRREIQARYISRSDEIKILETKIEDTNRQMRDWELEEQSLLKEREGIHKNLTDIKVKLASLEQEILSKRDNKQFLVQELDRHRQSISNKKQRIEDNKTLISTLQQINQQNREKIENLKKDIESAKATLKKINEQKAEMETNIEILYADYKRLEEDISIIIEKKHNLDIEISRAEVELDNIQNNTWEEYNISYNGALEYYDEKLSYRHIGRQIKKLKGQIEALGDVNVNAIEQYKTLNERYSFLKEQKNDLEMAIQDLKKVIEDITITMERQFSEEIGIINDYFNEVFSKLFGGGTAKLILSGEGSVLDCDIEIEAQPPGKKLQNISLLSGGEKALTAISLLFAILKRKPCPFCVLDEIDAALDESNLNNFCNFLDEFTDSTQFVIITHRKPTMEVCDVLYGIAMEEKGVSQIVSVRFDDMAS